MNAAWRAQRILANPAVEWTAIGKEPGDAAYLLTGYVAVLALIPAVFGFIGACVIGVAMPGGGIVRAPIFDGLFGAVFGYVMTCATVLVLGFLIDFLAPVFGGRKDFDRAFKLAVYSYTPVWLAGIFLLAPGLRFIGFLGFYGAYLLWTGLPQMMRVRSSSVLACMAVIVVSACVLIAGVVAAQHTLFGPSF